MILDWFDKVPRRILALIALVGLGLLAFALTLQYAGGLEPCPMCIVQRYALVLVIIVAGVAAAFKGRAAAIAGAIGVLVFSAGGAFVGGRQSWLQWHPPEFASCGRDFYGMIETFPLSRAIPMIFRGSGDCTKIDWTMLGLSVANWSFLWFCAIFAVATVLLVRQGASSVPRRRESRGARYNPLG